MHQREVELMKLDLERYKTDADNATRLKVASAASRSPALICCMPRASSSVVAGASDIVFLPPNGCGKLHQCGVTPTDGLSGRSLPG